MPATRGVEALLERGLALRDVPVGQLQAMDDGGVGDAEAIERRGQLARGERRRARTPPDRPPHRR